jgi:hypothetical protein
LTGSTGLTGSTIYLTPARLSSLEPQSEQRDLDHFPPYPVVEPEHVQVFEQNSL